MNRNVQTRMGVCGWRWNETNIRPYKLVFIGTRERRRHTVTMIITVYGETVPSKLSTRYEQTVIKRRHAEESVIRLCGI
jgi:hypothetical protein